MNYRIYALLKQFFDSVLAISALIILSPVLLVISLAIYIHLGSPVLFRQRRPGLHGRPFVMFKFRTMRNLNDVSGRPLPDSDRITALGIFLRSTSLDELPELFNVLKGDMSFIGPRPLLIDYLPLYTDEQFRRHAVKPGITGWAQINGRNLISWEDKFELDLWYVHHQSLLIDLKIFVITFWKILCREGITSHGVATSLPFLGSKMPDQ